MLTTSVDNITPLTNSQPIALAGIAHFGIDAFRTQLRDRLTGGNQLSALFGVPRDDGRLRLYAVLTRAATSHVSVFTTDVGESYPAFTPDVPQAHWFEREIAEQWGVVPDGHPWLKPIRFHRSYVDGRDAWGRKDGEEILPCVTDYFRVEGEEIHEVAVGPVHAGVIEPGHFRFQCHGEHVFTLEIELGFQHRGIERKLVGGPNKKTLHFMETLSGDTTVGHATAMPDRLRGLPVIDAANCPDGCRDCADACPTDAIEINGTMKLDLGKCLFCTDCVETCPEEAIRYTQDYRLAVRNREDLIVDGRAFQLAQALEEKSKKLFGRSLHLRQVSAGGCNGCEADINVLNTVGFDLSRFGIHIVASPRHADGLIITGPVTENMKLALKKTYAATPAPKIVIAVGACAISGGPFADHPQQNNGHPVQIGRASCRERV